jgi:hypothetical protein
MIRRLVVLAPVFRRRTSRAFNADVIARIAEKLYISLDRCSVAYKNAHNMKVNMFTFATL